MRHYRCQEYPAPGRGLPTAGRSGTTVLGTSEPSQRRILKGTLPNNSRAILYCIQVRVSVTESYSGWRFLPFFAIFAHFIHNTRPNREISSLSSVKRSLWYPLWNRGENFATNMDQNVVKIFQSDVGSARAPGRTVESRAMVDLLEGPPCLSMGPDPSYCGKGLGLFVKKKEK